MCGYRYWFISNRSVRKIFFRFMYTCTAVQIVCAQEVGIFLNTRPEPWPLACETLSNAHADTIFSRPPAGKRRTPFCSNRKIRVRRSASRVALLCAYDRSSRSVPTRPPTVRTGTRLGTPSRAVSRFLEASGKLIWPDLRP
jgi:hypothetical protein